MYKICTSLEQSKKLIELGIDIKTADMYWWSSGKRYYIEAIDDGDFVENRDIRAWSLTALMELMNRNCYNVSLNCHGAEWNIKFDDSEKYKDFTKDYSVDAAYEMVVWLKENNRL